MEWFVAFLAKYGAILVQGTLDTIVMVGASTAGAYLIGIPLGVLQIGRAWCRERV